MTTVNRLIGVLLVLLLCASTASAQMVMHTTVYADRIGIGGEFVPRRLDMPNVLNVAAGQTVELAVDSTFDYIEVSGTLRCSRTHNTTVRFISFNVLPIGTFDCGTQLSPIPASQHVELIIRNVPLDLARNPFQWGNSLLNFGHQTRVGAAKAPWTTATADIPAGATSFTLATDPTGWQIGDDLLVADSRQPMNSLPRGGFPNATTMPRRETPMTVAGITGRVITTSKPFDFEHLTVKSPDGSSVALLPRVVNLTTNIVVRSEDPTGTPGHSANVGGDTTWDIRYNEFIGLGRTKNIPIDSTRGCTPDVPDPAPPGRTWTCAHTGTNQIAKYNDHDHHAQGFGNTRVGNIYRGGGVNGVSGKWGISVHGTSDSLVQDAVCVDFPGSCFVTEDGYEVRNVFRHDIALYTLGNHSEDLNSEAGSTAGPNNIPNFNPGSAGNGWWQRGVMNIYDGVEAWDGMIGFNFFNQNQVPGNYPSVPGGPADTPLLARVAVPGAFINNVQAANVFKGLEYWSIPHFTVQNNTAAFNGVLQFFQSTSDGAAPGFANSNFVCVPGTTLRALQSGRSYVISLDIDGGYIGGCGSGIDEGGQRVHLRNVTMQNVLDINWYNQPFVSVHDNVTHIPLPGFPPQFIQFGSPDVWNGVLPTPVVGGSAWNPQRGSQHSILNWQGTGKNYQEFAAGQNATAAAWPSKSPWPDIFNCPEAGITMGQCWERYGIAILGEAVNVADTTPLVGFLNGFVREGLLSHFGPARAIVTWPTPRETVIPKLDENQIPYLDYYGVLTGDPSMATPSVAFTSIDGGPIVTLTADNGDAFHYWSYKVDPSITHEIRMWRSDGNNTPVGTPMVFHYTTAAVLPPPVCVPPTVLQGMTCVTPPPPPPVCVPPAVLTAGVCVTPPPPPPPKCVLPQVLVNGVCVTPPPPPPPVCKLPAVLMNGVCVTPPPPPPPVCVPPAVLNAAGMCVTPPPPPVPTWKANTGVLQQLFDVNGLPLNRYRYCRAVGDCLELVVVVSK